MNENPTAAPDSSAGHDAVWPVIRSYDEHHLDHISLPLGGIGTGTSGLKPRSVTAGRAPSV